MKLTHVKIMEDIMNLNEGNRKKLEKLISEHQCDHISEYLLENTRQGIRYSKSEVENYEAAGHSRIGGDPDLPSHTEWPATTDGIPMTFVAQLNLNDLAGQADTPLLPKSGMLYFFVGVDEPAYNIEHHVIHVQANELASVKRRMAPETTALEEQFNGYRIEARTSLEPPNYAYADYDVIESDTFDYDDYEDLTFAISEHQNEDIATMFGYPTDQHGDCEHEAALMILTGQDYDYHPEQALRQITDHFAGNRDKAEEEIQDTLMLLEIESDNDVGFCWWDAGVLHFFIRKEDLLAGRFDRTYCSLYSS